MTLEIKRWHVKFQLVSMLKMRYRTIYAGPRKQLLNSYTALARVKKVRMQIRHAKQG